MRSHNQTIRIDKLVTISEVVKNEDIFSVFQGGLPEETELFYIKATNYPERPHLF